MSSAFIQVKVKPKARRSALMQQADGSFAAEVKAAAIEGRANEELIALIADHFHCPRSAVAIKSGRSSRKKLIRIEKP